MLQLMGEQDLYDYWVDTMKTSATNWNQEAARSVLEAWQRKFVAVSIGCCFLMLVSLVKRSKWTTKVCVCVCCLLYTSPSPRDFG